MEDNIGALVPIVFLIGVFGVWIISRMMKHRERMAMLRMGIIPPRDMRRWQKGGGMGMPPGYPPGFQPGFHPASNRTRRCRPSMMPTPRKTKCARASRRRWSGSRC